LNQLRTSGSTRSEIADFRFARECAWRAIPRTAAATPAAAASARGTTPGASLSTCPDRPNRARKSASSRRAGAQRRWTARRLAKRLPAAAFHAVNNPAGPARPPLFWGKPMDLSRQQSYDFLYLTDGTARRAADPLLLVGRILLGSVFILTAWGWSPNPGYLTNLGYPAPVFMSWVAIAVEWVIGIALVLGIAVRYAALLGLPITYRTPGWVVVAENEETSGFAFQLAPDHRPPDWPDPQRPLLQLRPGHRDRGADPHREV